MQYTPIRSYRLHDAACFDPVTAGLAVASTAVSAAGTLAGGNAAAAAGQRQQQQAEYRAMVEEQNAQQSRALAQRTALDKRKEGAVAASRAQAMFAHAGGGADDPTVLNVTGKLAGRSEFDALFAMFKGESEARGREEQARQYRAAGEAALAEGAAKKAASRYAAVGTILNGASSIYGQFKSPKNILGGGTTEGFGSNDIYKSSSGSYGGSGAPGVGD